MPFRLVIDPSAVASEVIEGEAIIMQMRSGLYFSSRGHGAGVWELLVSGATLSQIADAASRASGAPREAVAKDIEAFATAAHAHGLGELVDADGDAEQTVPYAVSGAWAAPEFEVFSDMQDLLLLDPVHDVSAEMGWPQQKPL